MMILMTISFLLFLSRKARNFHHRFASARNKSSSSSARQYTRGRRFGENQSKSSSFSLLLVPLFLRPPRAFFYDINAKSCCCCCCCCRALKARCYGVVVFDTFPLSFRRREKEFTTYSLALSRSRSFTDLPAFGFQFRVTIKTLNAKQSKNPSRAWVKFVIV